MPPEIKRAVIVYRGELTPGYRYLEAYLQEQLLRLPPCGRSRAGASPAPTAVLSWSARFTCLFSPPMV